MCIEVNSNKVHVICCVFKRRHRRACICVCVFMHASIGVHTYVHTCVSVDPVMGAVTACTLVTCVQLF